MLRRLRQFRRDRDPEALIRSALLEVSALMSQAFEAVGGTPIRGSGLDQVGLVDGAEVIEDFLGDGHWEPGLALEHLIYMVREPPLAISESTYELIATAGRLLKMDPGEWEDIRPTTWYSSADWGPEAEKEFEAKLRRARNKGEHLRVKGMVLIQQRDESRRQAGRTLLLRLLRDFPDTPTIAWAWEALGQAEEADGHHDEAEQNYRQALVASARRPDIRGHGEVKLAGLITATHQRDKYAEASALLDAYRPWGRVEHFWARLARARLAADRGDLIEASSHARAALALHAQAPPYPEVGHIRTDAETLRELEALTHA